MVSGPNLNETSIVSGGYGGTAEGIIPTSSIKGRLYPLCLYHVFHTFYVSLLLFGVSGLVYMDLRTLVISVLLWDEVFICTQRDVFTSVTLYLIKN